jgi:hypothetical protein
MAFGIDTYDLPKLYKYEDAQKQFNETRAIRGGDQSMRRLGNITNQNKWLKREVRDGIDVYIAGYVNSGLIEYYPTHYNITMDGWYTGSTTAFIHKVAPESMSSHSRSRYIPSGFTNSMRFYGLDYAGCPINSVDTYGFSYDNQPLGEHPKRIKYAVDRKKMNAVMKSYKPFLQYVQAMHVLQGDTLKDIYEVRLQVYEVTKSHCMSNYLTWAEDEDTYWVGYLSLFHAAAKSEWSVGWVANINTMNHEFRKAVKELHGEELLKEVK